MATKLAQKVARIHQSQNPDGNRTSPGGGRWDGAMRGVPLMGPVPKTYLQQHEPSANNGGGKMFPGLGKRLGGPLKPRR